MKHLLISLAIVFLLPTSTVLQVVNIPLRITQLPIQSRQERLRDTTRNFIVIHNDGGNLSATQTRNVLRRRGLAYHYFVDRQGKIYEYVNPRYRASHAGTSFADGMWKWNDFSIGICLQGLDGVMYTDAQYRSLQLLIHRLENQYRLQPRIYTHSEIAFPWGRKSDPSETFDMSRIVIDTL